MQVSCFTLVLSAFLHHFLSRDPNALRVTCFGEKRGILAWLTSFERMDVRILGTGSFMFGLSQSLSQWPQPPVTKTFWQAYPP
jgi:hypothetical protein